MRVLLTGVSSFTGTWIARALRDAGADVVAACRGRIAEGGPDRRARLVWAADRCTLVEDCPFGSAPFLALVRRAGPFDLLGHHGAEVGDHRRPDLDVPAAVAANTRGIEPVLDGLAAGGCRTVLVTGTVFEADEGRGGDPLRAFSPYGLSKTLSWQVVRYHAERRGLTLGKFVIASPFGPLEKPGLPRHLAESWRRGEVPVLRRPQLVRDHVQVQLLAAAYAGFARSLLDRSGTHRLTPSQYPERLDAFAARLAAALRARLGWRCRFTLLAPPEPVDEPLERCGIESLAEPGTAAAWDAYARSLA